MNWRVHYYREGGQFSTLMTKREALSHLEICEDALYIEKIKGVWKRKIYRRELR